MGGQSAGSPPSSASVEVTAWVSVWPPLSVSNSLVPAMPLALPLVSPGPANPHVMASSTLNPFEVTPPAQFEATPPACRLTATTEPLTPTVPACRNIPPPPASAKLLMIVA
jgi:hypothetical protein